MNEEQIRALLAELGQRLAAEGCSAEDAFAIVERYYPRSRIPAKTQFFLEEALGPELDR